ncbi:MAG: HD domain-containing protein [Flavitalea sp.]
MELLLESAIRHVTLLYEEHWEPELCFHNLNHTVSVADRAEVMIQHFRFGPTQQLIIRLAAWFHDVGHLFGRPKGHERRSIELMEEFLLANNCPQLVTQHVATCILATKVSASPVSLPEKILCDANQFHFGTVSFFESDEKLRKEMQSRNDEIIRDWDINTLAMLTRHRFQTIYCRERLDAAKAHNISLLRLRLAQKSN